MFDLNTIAEFSRNNCIGICSFLVPANLLSTSLTIGLSALRRSSAQVWQSAAFASFWALVMVFHVYTWFMVGVVMLPTFILMWLAVTCWICNLGAILFSKSHCPLPDS